MQEHAEEITAAREKARQEQKRQLALAAKAAVAAFKPTDVPYQSSGLSPAWKHVLQHLAKPLEVHSFYFLSPSKSTPCSLHGICRILLSMAEE